MDLGSEATTHQRRTLNYVRIALRFLTFVCIELFLFITLIVLIVWQFQKDEDKCEDYIAHIFTLIAIQIPDPAAVFGFRNNHRQEEDEV